MSFSPTKTPINMQFLKNVLSRTATVKFLWFLFLSSHIVLVLMMIFTFPRINNQIGNKAFDLQTFGYSVSEARSIVNAMNEQIINLYLFPQLSLFDLLYPLLLALFLSSFLFRLINLTQTKKGVGSFVLIVPFLAMLFDYLENICIILMITKSADLSEYFVLVSSTFTVLKSILTTFAWLCVLFYSLKWIGMKKWKA